jgi:hypothetical protein
MFDDVDREYFRKRSEEARTLADQATDAAVRRIHLDMAEEYDRRAQGLAPQPVTRLPN